jgi:hypothetical protein
MPELSSVLALVFGASGWGVAVFKVITDLREDKRKAREDLRKEREEVLKEQEAKSKIADQIAPLIRELNDSEYLQLLKQIKKKSSFKEDGTEISPDDQRALMNYPGKLEDIGALMLAGKFSRHDVYEWFGEEILVTAAADFLWQGEDPHYWRIFRLLVNAMKEEEALREPAKTDA